MKFVLITLGILLLLIYRCFLSKVNRYIPAISLFVSTDNGKTYSNNLKSVPLDTVVYLKYEISIKPSGLWWVLFGNIVDFDIECPSGIELCDYSYFKRNGKKHVDASPVEYEAEVSPAGADKGSPSKYKVRIKASETYFSFRVAASHKPRKPEIIFKIPEQQAETFFSIKFICGKNIHEVYNKYTTLEFIQKPDDEAKPCDSFSEKFYINSDISVYHKGDSKK
jgi:hypothetical protein